MSNKLTYKEVENFVLNNSNCILISNSYVNNSTKMWFKCGCGNKFETTYSSFNYKNKRQCNECSKEIVLKKKQLDYNVLKDFVENVYGKSRLKLLTKEKYYKNAQTNLDIIDDDNYLYQTTLSNLYYFYNNNRDLTKFSKSNKYTISNIRIWMKDSARGYKILSNKYDGNRKKLEFECDKGHVFETTWVSFYNNGTRCPYCRNSKGETQIRYYLEDNNINFEQEYIFDNCRNERPLPFDFAVFVKDKLKLLIEFDGEQHFRAMSNFGGKEKLIYMQHNDSIKNKFCEENDIDLLRISFKRIDEIDKILDKKLKELNIQPNQQIA